MLKRLFYSQQPTLISLIGFALCLVFAFGEVHFQSVSKNAEHLITLLGLFCIYRYGKGVAVKTPMWLLLASILIPLLSWSLARLAEPGWVEDAPQLEKLARLFIFVPLAWFLKDSTKRVFLFWSLAALMLLLSPWLSGNGWQELQQGWQGRRIDLDLRNAQHTALFFGFATLGLFAFLPRLYRWQPLSLIVWLPAVSLCLFMLFASQTRAAWLAIVAAVIVALIYFVYTLIKGQQTVKKHWLIMALVASVVALIALEQTLWPKIEQRFAQGGNSEVAVQMLHGNFENIPYNSWGIRANTWIAGFEHIAERPLTGWGGQGQKIAIKRTEWLPEHIRNEFGHMHNIYIALLLQYGVIGLLFYLLWVGWMLTTVLKAVAHQRLNQDVGYFALAGIGFWSVISMAESYLFFWTGVLCLQIFFAGLLALVWRSQLTPNET